MLNNTTNQLYANVFSSKQYVALKFAIFHPENGKKIEEMSHFTFFAGSVAPESILIFYCLKVIVV